MCELSMHISVVSCRDIPHACRVYSLTVRVGVVLTEFCACLLIEGRGVVGIATASSQWGQSSSWPELAAEGVAVGQRLLAEVAGVACWAVVDDRGCGDGLGGGVGVVAVSAGCLTAGV